MKTMTVDGKYVNIYEDNRKKIYKDRESPPM